MNNTYRSVDYSQFRNVQGSWLSQTYVSCFPIKRINIGAPRHAAQFFPTLSNITSFLNHIDSRFILPHSLHTIHGALDLFPGVSKECVDICIPAFRTITGLCDVIPYS